MRFFCGPLWSLTSPGHYELFLLGKIQKILQIFFHSKNKKKIVKKKWLFITLSQAFFPPSLSA